MEIIFLHNMGSFTYELLLHLTEETSYLNLWVAHDFITFELEIPNITEQYRYFIFFLVFRMKNE